MVPQHRRRPWECCPREFLRRAVAALVAAAGLHLIAAFEQEFVYTGVEDCAGPCLQPRRLAAPRRVRRKPDRRTSRRRAQTWNSSLPEYGARQYEVTIAPQPALKAADQAVIVREIARATAFRLGHRAIFSPMPVADGAGNGVHIHFSLHDASGAPGTYDADGPLGLSEPPRNSAPACCIICRRSRPSPRRRRCPICGSRRTAGRRPRSTSCSRTGALHCASVRCLTRRQKKIAEAFNLEFRVSDGSASPYMALGALIFAGADGIARKLALPKYGGEAPPLPRSLEQALDGMEKSEAVQGGSARLFSKPISATSAPSSAHVAGLEPPELCARYAEVY